MAHDDRHDGDPKRQLRSAEDDLRRARRRILKVGAVLVPTIATLHATPAWAQTDYTMVAYRYGANAGKCRNPRFNPHASSNSPNSHEFIDCPLDKGNSHLYWSPENQSGSSGTTTIGD